MIQFVATVKEKNKRVAIAIIEYPEGATTCIARARDFLFVSNKLNVPLEGLNVSWMESVKNQKNFVLPAGVPVFQA